MSLQPEKKNPKKATFGLSLHDAVLKPSLTGLCQSEKNAYQLILDFMEPGQMLELDKLNFLNAVEILSSLVRDQTNGNMNNYYPKTLLAKKIEKLILEESTEILDSSVREQAMLCIVILSQVKPPFHFGQKLELVSSCVTSIFSLPLITPSLDRKESASLYLQTIQALDDMLQALVMEDLKPNMFILQSFLEIILPWLTQSDKMHKQIRALGSISRLLRFICNFSDVSNMASFSIIGKLIGTFSLLCLDTSQEISAAALEALYYLFTILVLQRRVRLKMETVLKNLQKHFRGNWMANMQNLTLFFRKYLTPIERADMILVAMEAMTSGSKNDVFAASQMLKMVLQHPFPEVAKEGKNWVKDIVEEYYGLTGPEETLATLPASRRCVPEIIQFIYYCIDRVTEKTVQGAIMKVFQLLVQSHTDEVILSLFKIKEQSESGIHRSWEILASFPKGYGMIMDYLLQRILSSLTPNDQQTDHKTELSAMIATRAIHEMLLVPSHQGEVQTYFAPLFVVLLFQISFLVTKESTVIPDERNESKYVDSVSSSVEALKTLMRSSGYTDHMSYIQTVGAWELLVSPERHYSGVTLLARSLAIKNCWHNRPVFSFLIRTLQDPHCANYFTALVFLAELLRCPDVAGAVDAVSTRILANWFRCEELSTGRLLLQIAEIFTKHKNTIMHLQILHPYMLSYCYSTSSDLVMETFLTLQRILKNLTWQHFSTFITHLAFNLEHFFEEESEQLRLIIFTIYSSILAKVSRKTLDFPLKHQVLNSIVLLVSHLEDVNADVEEVRSLTVEPGIQFPLEVNADHGDPLATSKDAAEHVTKGWVPSNEVCRVSLCNTATILGWSKLKGVFTKKDVFTILIALLQHERSKALWLLKQSVALFKSPQGPIRQVAVWFSGQIIRILNREEKEKIEDERAALMCMQKDPDPTVSCLTMQTFYILEAKNVVPEPKTFFSCLCSKRLHRR